MNVLVNNSISGSNVVSCQDRPVNLHANTGALAGTNPDVILVYFCINDVGASSITAEMFEEAYRAMIAKMVAKYPNADIFVIDLPYPNASHSLDKLNQFNAIIHEIVAETEGVELIQFRNTKADNAATLTCDGLHPNAAGMKAYYEVIRDALYDYYCA
jgi:lysophospholipase L1-like esterase